MDKLNPDIFDVILSVGGFCVIFLFFLYWKINNWAILVENVINERVVSDFCTVLYKYSKQKSDHCVSKVFFSVEALKSWMFINSELNSFISFAMEINVMSPLEFTSKVKKLQPQARFRIYLVHNYANIIMHTIYN